MMVFCGDWLLGVSGLLVVSGGYCLWVWDFAILGVLCMVAGEVLVWVNGYGLVF